MAFTGANMFSILDDEDGPKPVVARVPVPAPAAKPVAKPVARQADKPGGNAGGAKGKPRAPRAPREFEGEVVGTEGAKARPRNSDRQRKPKEGEAGPGRRNDRADRSGRGCVSGHITFLFPVLRAIFCVTPHRQHARAPPRVWHRDTARPRRRGARTARGPGIRVAGVFPRTMRFQTNE